MRSKGICSSFFLIPEDRLCLLKKLRNSLSPQAKSVFRVSYKNFVGKGKSASFFLKAESVS